MDDDAVVWLESTATAALVSEMNRSRVRGACLADEQDDVGEECSPQLESAEHAVQHGRRRVRRRLVHQPDADADPDRHATVEHHADPRHHARPVDLPHRAAARTHTETDTCDTTCPTEMELGRIL